MSQLESDTKTFPVVLPTREEAERCALRKLIEGRPEAIKARNHAVMYGEGVYASDGSFTPRDDLQAERIAAAVALLNLKIYSNCAPPASGVVDFGVGVVQGLRGPVMHWHDARVPQPVQHAEPVTSQAELDVLKAENTRLRLLVSHTMEMKNIYLSNWRNSEDQCNLLRDEVVELRSQLAALSKSPAPTPELTDIIAVKWPSADPFARRKDKLASWAGED